MENHLSSVPKAEGAGVSASIYEASSGDGSKEVSLGSADPLVVLGSLPAGVISNWTDENRIPPCTIFQAFKYYLDITTPPTPLLLQQFALLATSDKEKKRLQVLSKVKPQMPLAGTCRGGFFPPPLHVADLEGHCHRFSFPEVRAEFPQVARCEPRNSSWHAPGCSPFSSASLPCGSFSRDHSLCLVVQPFWLQIK